MPFTLSDEARAAGYRLEAHDTVGSTNALALERARSGDRGPLWLAALAQSDGRGRRGRAWSSPHGNLAASLLLTLDEPRWAATLGFVAGVALSDAFASVLPRQPVRVGLDGGGTSGEGRFALKWPNDVLADGAKLAGILLESGLLPDGRLALAIGLGVNVVAHPADLPYPATSLRALGSDASAPYLFAELSRTWTARAAEWDGGRGLERIRRAWLDRAAGLGSEIAVKLESGLVRGVFQAIDEDCRLVLRDRAGQEFRIAAGDVHFGAVATISAA